LECCYVYTGSHKISLGICLKKVAFLLLADTVNAVLEMICVYEYTVKSFGEHCAAL
jgi:hypothetical protein